MKILLKLSLQLCILCLIINQGMCQRKYVHSQEELALTTIISEEINHPGCKDNDIAFIVHSAATSSGQYYDKRQANRETWVIDANLKNISVIFIIGLPRDEETQLQLIQESNTYKDMVQFSGFIDDYYNLTLKAIGVNYWLTKYCTNVHLIAKLDDDIFVNVEKFIELKYQFNPGMTGHIFGYQDKPDRNNESDWYMPEWAYPNEWYPIYIAGLFYIMSKDIIHPLYIFASNWSSTIIYYDDVYMSGIIADRIHIEKHRSNYIIYRVNQFPNCGVDNIEQLNDLIAYHGCSKAEYSINLYKTWKQIRQVDEDNDNCINNSIQNTYSLIYLVLSCILYFFQI